MKNSRKKHRSLARKFRGNPSTATFRSRFEEKIADECEKQGWKVAYEPFKVGYVVHKHYTPDFELPNKIIVEAKGYFRSEDQRKMKLVKAQHPEKDFRMVFQNPTGKVQGSKMTCIEWSEKYNFKWAGSSIPKEWFSESQG